MFEAQSSALYAIARVGGINLAFPQQNIMSIETLTNFSATGNEGLSVGFVALAGEDIPLYVLSGELDPRSEIDREERFFLCLDGGSDNSRYAITASAVNQIKLNDTIKITELPFICRTEYTPIIGVSNVNKEIAFICTATSLLHYLMNLEALNE